IDAWLMNRVGGHAKDHTEPAGFGMMQKKWIGWTLFFALSALFMGVGACCTFARRDAAFEKTIENFVEEGLPASETPLFNGKNLGGWEVHGFGSWSVENGVVTARRGMGYLSTRCDAFTDFILDVDVNVNRRGNSGIFFRAGHPGRGLRSQPVGYEAQVDHHDPKNPTGSLYNRVTAHPVLSRDGEWFHMTITAVEEKIQIQVNGTTVVDATAAKDEKGFIALQAHDPFSVVSFKNLRIRMPEEE
ncbi:MAG: 3-keto-disaccharide hydrolase, partial [Candidatus Hinthialibacter sp.]